MKKAVTHSFSIALACLVLLSTFSWTVDKHLCMGRVMDVAFFHGAEDCGMKAALAALEMEQENPGCCDDDSFTLTGQDDLIKVSWDDLDFEQQVFLQTYTVAYLHLLSVALEEVATPLIEAPPLPERKLHQLYEVYLI